MTREDLETYILGTYNCTPDYPWVRFPNHEVFRHPDNKKWFALLADVPAKILLPESDPLSHMSIVNLKCDPILSSSLRQNEGFYPAYHMNKDKWITLDLAVVSEENIKWLLGMSFDSTAPKPKKARQKKDSMKPTEKKDSMKPTVRKKRRYPEDFFLDLFGKELSDIQYADTVLSAILTIGNNSKPTKEKRYEIMTNYYVKGQTLKEIGEKYNVSHSRIQQIIRRQLRILQGYLIRIQVPTSTSKTSIVYDWNLNTKKYQYPTSYAEIHAHLEERRKEKEAIELEQRSQILYPDSDIGNVPLSIRLLTRLIKHGILTVGQFMALTPDTKLEEIGEKSWAEIKAAQEEVSKQYRKSRG